MNRLSKVMVMILSLLLVVYSIPVYGASPVIVIENQAQLRAFAQDCVLDAYSKDKIVVLKNDIDLMGQAFSPIPSFSGVFDGNGYTIKNLRINDEGSHRGLFRYVEVTGVVRHLKVEGIVEPIGTESEVGGIVGVNKGVLTDVSFKGQVSGLTSIGGLVGLNETTGSILNSYSDGVITGEHYTGGIVGKNLGYVSACENYAAINTTDDTIKSNDMASYDLDKIDLNDTDSTEDVEAQTDTGGIAGYSTGILKGNINYGRVGYQHVGYNIGGIVGRHNGYIRDNINHGQVYGRKDVGGIVGQMEPYVRLLFSEDTLQELDQALVEMNETTKQLVDDGYGASKDISRQLEDFNQKMKKTSDDLQILLRNTTSYADDAGETLNDGFDRLHTMMVQFEYVIDEMKASTQDINQGLNHLGDGFDDLADGSESVESSISDLQTAMHELDKAMEDLDKALTKINKGMNLIGQAAETSEQYDEGMRLVLEGLDDLEQASIKANEAIGRIADYYNDHGSMLGFDYGPTFVALGEALDHLNQATPKLRSGFTLLSDEFQDDMELIQAAFIWFDAANKDLQAMNDDLLVMKDYLDESLFHLRNATGDFSDAMRDFSASSDAFALASDHMTMSFEYFDMMLNDQQRRPALSFPILSDYTEESSEVFFDDLSDLSLSITKLNHLLSSSSDMTYENLKQLNSDYEKVMDIVRDGINALSFDEGATFEDISDVESEEIIEKGLTVNCTNYGQIQGDVDVGGIAGAIAIEYDFDPEDDIVKKGNRSFNFKYQTKANLLSSRNEGDISSKKNYAGGIVGRMDLGLVSSSENYSSVESLDGDYVGGIAGSSNGIIRSSYSISRLSGKKYVGGIAGYGLDIYDSFVMMTIDRYEEYAGSIAGRIQGDYIGNAFVVNQWAGVDGISYDGKATPELYENIGAYDLPDPFNVLTVTYFVEDEMIEVQNMMYGDNITLSQMPEIPEKEGYSSKWSIQAVDSITFNHIIRAEYQPLRQVIASEEDQPLLLVEGVFAPADHLNLTVNHTYDVIKGHTLVEEYLVQVLTSDKDEKTYRLLKPEEDVQVYVNSDNQWQHVETHDDGSYLVFSYPSNNFQLALLTKPTNYNVFYVLGSLTLVIITAFILRKRKAKSPTS